MLKIVYLLILLALNAFGFESFNYVNKNYKITQASELEDIYDTKISPHFDKEPLNYFIGKDKIKIAYKIFIVPNAKANIVISSGRTEGMIKYKELIYDLNRNGYSVYIHDHRGQGFSSRVLDDSQIGHVKDFSYYVEDMKSFVEKIVVKDKKIILLGHSMGGAIASLYIEKYIYDFDALILSSPMHQPAFISLTMSDVMCYLIEKRENDIDKYILGESSYDDEQVSFRENILTHSPERFAISNIEYAKYPQTKLGGPSVRWVKEACIWSAKSIQMASKIKIPVLLMQAEQDQIVNLKPQEEFCKSISELCRGIKIDGAYHELFVEKDEIRNRIMTAMFDFFKLQIKR